MWNPCCGSSLKQGTKFLALLSMILSLMGIVSAIYYLLEPSTLKSEQEPPDEFELYFSIEDYCNDSIMPKFVMIFLIQVICVLNLFFAIILFIGAEQENHRVCSFWWKISFVLCVIDILFLVVSAVACTANVTDIVINTAGVIRSVYELWVVKAFICELEAKPENNNGCRVVISMT